MRLEDLTLEIRDPDLDRVGQIPWEDMDFELTDYFNNVGTWTLSLESDHPLAPVLRTPGAGIVVTLPNGYILTSGPVLSPEDASTPTDIEGTLTVTGVTDTTVLADMLSWPVPTSDTIEGQTASHDVRTGPVETLMHQYVNANAGPGAPTSRRKPRLVMGTNLGRGPTVKKSARFPKLGVLCNELASLGNLGFRVVQRGTNLVFETYAVEDRSAYIRLDIRNGTLSGQKVATAAPGATHVLVAGQGEGVDRAFLLASTSASEAAAAAWRRRIERFVDQRQTDDETEYQDKADEILSEEGFTQYQIQVVPLDDETSGMRFGKDWNLGDQVTVVAGDKEFTSLVTGFKMKVDESGFRIGALIGQAGEDAQASFESRLSALERNAESLTRSDVQSVVASMMQPGVAPGVALFKTTGSNQTFASSALSNEADLSFDLAASAEYEIEWSISAYGPGDIKFDLVVPSGSTAVKAVIGPTNSATTWVDRDDTNGYFAWHAPATVHAHQLTTTGGSLIVVRARIKTTSAGTARLRAAQNTSNATVTVIEGGASYARLIRMS